MTNNAENRPNTYLDEARKFKAAQENANALEVQKLINALDAASEAERDVQAMLARLQTEIAYINEALGELGAQVMVDLGEPRNASVIVVDEDAQMPADRQAKVVEGPLPKEVPWRDDIPAFAEQVQAVLRNVGADLTSVPIDKLLLVVVDWLGARNAPYRGPITNALVRRALVALHDQKVVKWVKNERVMLRS